MDKLTVNAELNQLADELRPVDPQAAGQILQLGSWLAQQQLGAKAHLDPYAILDPQRVEANVLSVYRRRPLGLNLLTWLRAMLIWLPICLTGYVIAQLVASYAHLSVTRPEVLEQSFWSLWERGAVPFEAPAGLTLSRLVWLDFWLFVAVVGLTFVLHVYRDRHEAGALEKGAALRRRLESVLWMVGQLWAEERFRQSQAAAISHFEESARKLVETLDYQADQLSKLESQRQREMSSLTVLGGNLTTATRNLQRASEDMQRMWSPLQESVQALGRQVESVGARQNQLAEAVTRLSEHVAELRALLQRTSQTLESSAEEIGVAATALSSNAQSTLVSYQDTCQAMTDLLTRLDAVTTNLRLATAHAGELEQGMSELLGTLQSAGQQLVPALQAFSEQTSRSVAQLTSAVSYLERSTRRVATAASPSERLLMWLATLLLVGALVVLFSRAAGWLH